MAASLLRWKLDWGRLDGRGSRRTSGGATCGASASTRGLTISALAAVILVNFLSLTTIASLGAATSLLVYSLVNFGALRLVGGGGIKRVWIVLSVVACLVAIAIWVVYTLEHAPQSLTIFVAFLVLAFLSEGLIQRARGNRLRSGPGRDGASD